MLNPGGRAGGLNDVAIQPDGKIVRVGSVDDGTVAANPGCAGQTANDFAVWRSPK